MQIVKLRIFSENLVNICLESYPQNVYSTAHYDLKWWRFTGGGKSTSGVKSRIVIRYAKWMYVFMKCCIGDDGQSSPPHGPVCWGLCLHKECGDHMNRGVLLVNVATRFLQLAASSHPGGSLHMSRVCPGDSVALLELIHAISQRPVMGDCLAYMPPATISYCS